MRVARRVAPVLLAGLVSASCGSEGGKALGEAIQKEDIVAVEQLLALGGEPNETLLFQGRKTTPWRMAVLKLDYPTEAREAIALAVLEAGGDPDLRWWVSGDADGYWKHAIEAPAGGGSERLVEALIDAGATVADWSGGEALIAAAAEGHVDILRILIDSGAPADFKSTRNGETPLGAAVEASSRAAIEYLESVGAREW